MPRPPLSMRFSRAALVFTAALRREFAAQGLADVVEPGMGPLLFALAEHGSLTMSDLAGTVGIARSTMTGVGRRMEDQGLVETSPDTEDGRAVRVRLTPRGRRVLTRLRAIEKRMDAAMSRDLSASSHGALFDALASVHGALAATSPRKR